MPETVAGSDPSEPSAGRWPLGLAVALALVLVGGSPRQDPLLVWNASASSPRGLYLFSPGTPRVGDYVLARAPEAAGRLAIARGYLAPGVPLVKSVAAGPGDQVCAAGDRVAIGELIAVRRAADRLGRELPRWSECRRLREGEVFLVGSGDPASFDSRYFGPVGADRILGRASLLWRL